MYRNLLDPNEEDNAIGRRGKATRFNEAYGTYMSMSRPELLDAYGSLPQSGIEKKAWEQAAIGELTNGNLNAQAVGQYQDVVGRDNQSLINDLGYSLQNTYNYDETAGWNSYLSNRDTAVAQGTTMSTDFLASQLLAGQYLQNKVRSNQTSGLYDQIKDDDFLKNTAVSAMIDEVVGGETLYDKLPRGAGQYEGLSRDVTTEDALGNLTTYKAGDKSVEMRAFDTEWERDRVYMTFGVKPYQYKLQTGTKFKAVIENPNQLDLLGSITGQDFQEFKNLDNKVLKETGWTSYTFSGFTSFLFESIGKLGGSASGERWRAFGSKVGSAAFGLMDFTLRSIQNGGMTIQDIFDGKGSFKDALKDSWNREIDVSMQLLSDELGILTDVVPTALSMLGTVIGTTFEAPTVGKMVGDALGGLVKAGGEQIKYGLYNNNDSFSERYRQAEINNNKDQFAYANMTADKMDEMDRGKGDATYTLQKNFTDKRWQKDTVDANGKRKAGGGGTDYGKIALDTLDVISVGTDAFNNYNQAPKVDTGGLKVKQDGVNVNLDVGKAIINTYDNLGIMNTLTNVAQGNYLSALGSLTKTAVNVGVQTQDEKGHLFGDMKNFKENEMAYLTSPETFASAGANALTTFFTSSDKKQKVDEYNKQAAEYNTKKTQIDYDNRIAAEENTARQTANTNNTNTKREKITTTVNNPFAPSAGSGQSDVSKPVNTSEQQIIQTDIPVNLKNLLDNAPDSTHTADVEGFTDLSFNAYNSKDKEFDYTGVEGTGEEQARSNAYLEGEELYKYTDKTDDNMYAPKKESNILSKGGEIFEEVGVNLYNLTKDYTEFSANIGVAGAGAIRELTGLSGGSDYNWRDDTVDLSKYTAQTSSDLLISNTGQFTSNLVGNLIPGKVASPYAMLSAASTGKDIMRSNINNPNASATQAFTTSLLGFGLDYAVEKNITLTESKPLQEGLEEVIQGSMSNILQSYSSGDSWKDTVKKVDDYLSSDQAKVDFVSGAVVGGIVGKIHGGSVVETNSKGSPSAFTQAATEVYGADTGQFDTVTMSVEGDSNINEVNTNKAYYKPLGYGATASDIENRNTDSMAFNRDGTIKTTKSLAHINQSSDMSLDLGTLLDLELSPEQALQVNPDLTINPDNSVTNTINTNTVITNQTRWNLRKPSSVIPATITEPDDSGITTKSSETKALISRKDLPDAPEMGKIYSIPAFSGGGNIYKDSETEKDETPFKRGGIAYSQAVQAKNFNLLDLHQYNWNFDYKAPSHNQMLKMAFKNK